MYEVRGSKDAQGRTIPFPDDQLIAELAKKHSFPEGFRLPSRLKHVWDWWRGDHYVGQGPSNSDRKKLLNEIADRARCLSDALERCGHKENLLLLESATELSNFRDACESLWLSARIAAKEVAANRRGRRRDGPMLNLIARLFRLWVAAFGEDAPRITRVGTHYSGPFFDFSNDVLVLFDMRKQSNGALGKRIEEAIKLLDTAVAEGLIPQIASESGSI